MIFKDIFRNMFKPNNTKSAAANRNQASQNNYDQCSNQSLSEVDRKMTFLSKKITLWLKNIRNITYYTMIF